MSEMKQQLLTVNDAAIMLGRTSKAIRRMYESGKLPVVRIDGRVQFRLAELEKLIEGADSEKSGMAA